MDKNELLRELSAKIAAGEISREDVTSRFESTHREPEGSGIVATLQKRHFSVTQLLYILGMAVVTLGIIFLVAQIWDDLGSAGRILITFVLGLVFAGAGSSLFVSKPESQLGTVFHAIGGFLIPGGALVTLYEISPDIDTLWPITAIFGVLFVFYFLLTIFHKHVVLTFFTVANGTVFIYLLVSSMLEDTYFDADIVFAYLTMAVGLSYLLLAYAFREGWNKRLIDSLNFLGSVGFLGAAFSRVFDSVPWQLFFFVLAFGGMALAVYLKSRNILIISTLFLIGHFAYITNEYFADSIGWPVSLILLGFLFIGLGYASITINKKYIR